MERFHGTLRPEFLDVAGPFISIDAAQAELDAWVEHYNSDRPHQALDDRVQVLPTDRFTPVPAEQRDLIDLWLPPHHRTDCHTGVDSGTAGAHERTAR